ncbi:MAG: VTT domain-containing protein [Alphaproteobacteria bacterium]|nr:VTT domain-containing protein [Alphaproteobacteria bacterium]
MKLQEYLLKHSDSKWAVWVVFFMTLADSIFLFVPPEVFMTPPIVANKKKALPVVIAASVGSIIGAIITYAIGMWLFESVGGWLINTFSSPEQFLAAKEMFTQYGLLIILIAAFTPVPYKLLTLVAGFIGFNPLLYLGFTAIGRAMRFAVAGWLLWRFQEQANKIVKKYFWPLAIAAVLAAVIGVFLLGLL